MRQEILLNDVHYYNFNSRTPRGMRHLPLRRAHDTVHFNSRTPRGMRLLFWAYMRCRIRFQLTHPTRDATAINKEYDALYSISTHAPHAGCDTTWCCGNSKKKFQLTHPTRDATTCTNAVHTFVAFQLTHPTRDATWRP